MQQRYFKYIIFESFYDNKTHICIVKKKMIPLPVKSVLFSEKNEIHTFTDILKLKEYA